MKFSLSWLRQYLSVTMPVKELADALTMAGLEIDSVSDRYAYLDTVIAGRILDISPHPNADKLKLCQVDIGKEKLTIVCGAQNIEKNMMVACALPGTILPDGQQLEKGTIRGQESQGMLCSEMELGLGPAGSGIMVLDPDTTPSAGLASVLGLSDTVFEVDLTPNRPDCLSITGIARETAAIQKSRVDYPEIDTNIQGNAINEYTSVTIEDPDLCPRYATRILFDISVGPSPFWLQDRLLSIGLRPINNIVDITNFVMMETGQPLHAFDFDRLAGHCIVVKKAGKHKTFTTLDNKERKISSDTLLICDKEKPVALAGVMGGLNSEIDEKTTRVLIESAYFNPASIRKTAKSLGLGTDASHRFERGVDPAGTVKALARAAKLIEEIAGGKLIDGILDVHPNPTNQGTILLSTKKTNDILGLNQSQDIMANYLTSIEFLVEQKDNDVLEVTPPSFRVDVTRPEDLMEEVARLSGYNNIPTTFPLIPSNIKPPDIKMELRERIKSSMLGFGFSEAVNYSFISESSCDLLKLGPDDPRRGMVRILNPLTEDQAVMRTSLIPGLLGSIRHNITRQVKTIRFFETGKIFFHTQQDQQPKEIEVLACIWTGKRRAASWLSKETECDFFDLKGVAEALLKGLKIEDVTFTALSPESCDYTKPGHSAQILAGKTIIGTIGELHQDVRNNLDLKQTAFIFELNLSVLVPLIPLDKKSTPLPIFPATSRDMTLIIEKNIEADYILRSIKQINEKLVENIFLFDVYEGKPIQEGQKSLSIRIIYRSSDETLEDERVNDIHKNMTNRLLKEFNATLPA